MKKEKQEKAVVEAVEPITAIEVDPIEVKGQNQRTMPASVPAQSTEITPITEKPATNNVRRSAREYILRGRDNTPPQSVAPQNTTVESPQRPASVATPASQSQSVEVAPQAPIQRSYEDMYKELNVNPTLSAEDAEAQAKRERRQKLFSAIGDGLTSLSNLYFTTQGAPSHYTGQNTMSDATKARWQKLHDEAEADRLAYAKGLMSAKQLDEEQAKAQREWERILANDKLEQDNKRKDRRLKKKAQEEIARHNKEQEALSATKEANALSESQKRRAQDESQFERKEARLAGDAKKSSSKGDVITFFDDATGKQVDVSKDLWEGSAVQLYDAIEADFKKARANDPKFAGRPLIGGSVATNKMKEDYILSNWYKSPTATAIIQRFAGDAGDAGENETIEEWKPLTTRKQYKPKSS